jgi:hypothetical protein
MLFHWIQTLKKYLVDSFFKIGSFDGRNVFIPINVNWTLNVPLTLLQISEVPPPSQRSYCYCSKVTNMSYFIVKLLFIQFSKSWFFDEWLSHYFSNVKNSRYVCWSKISNLSPMIVNVEKLLKEKTHVISPLRLKTQKRTCFDFFQKNPQWRLTTCLLFVQFLVKISFLDIHVSFSIVMNHIFKVNCVSLKKSQ